MATQKVPLTITYRHAGTQPPIFLAGEFSDPPWEPQEMDYTTAEDGEHTFKKEVFAEPGSKVQYKFRVGLGDWWVLNDDAPTAMDDGGFLNNLAEVPALAEPSTPAAVAEKARQIASGDAGNADAQKNGDSKSTEAVKSRDQEEPTIANAAKELRHRPDLHSGTGTSTPEFARTAAEVADSAALLDKEDEEPYVANAAKELMHRLDPRSGSGAGSGASTPSFVRTAAEVADSAALLDKEDSEPEVTDEEAGKTGFRRLSSTPIQDVAAVAAEVADTAKDLDRESFPQLEVRPAEYDDIDPYEFDEPVVSENKAPLFAHECVGMELYEGDDAPGPLDDEHHNNEYEEDRRPSTVYDDDEEIDLNDPTLERFPSNREEIIDTVRKLEGGLNEDHADVEGLVPLSPVVGPSGPQNHDLVGDFLVSSPAVSSPIVTRGSGSGSRLLSLPRASFGSINSDRASALSLDSISEEEARDEAELDQLPVLSTPKPRKHPSADDTKSPTSDDDEGIVMKSGSGQNGNSSEVSPSEVTPVRTPGGDSTPKTPPAESRTEDHHDSSDGQPEIKLVPASEATETQTPEVAPQTNGERGSSSPRIVIQNEETGEGTENHAEESADTSAPSTADTTKSTGADNGAQSQLRRRVVPPDRVATPSSINDAHIQAAKSGNWFRSFFKVLFVDWIGGFINKLFGRKRETLLAAGAAGILIGVAWWRNTSK